jgi:hypothetical protein
MDLIHRRLSLEFVEGVLEAFNGRRMSEVGACELLGIKSSRLYELRRDWLRKSDKGEAFKLWNREGSDFHQFPTEVEEWLHKELRYIKEEAGVYQGKYNFAFIAEEAQKAFGRRFHRNSLRRWAIREGYYHCLPEEKSKVYRRFEAKGPGMLFQHDSSIHEWMPGSGRKDVLIITEDDYSRMVVGWGFVSEDTAFDHLQVARKTVEAHGRALSYYVDNHRIFRYVSHGSIHYNLKLKTDEAQSQFKRALGSLDIGLIYARTPQAKGKVEKRFDYFQRRIPFLCEKYRVDKVEEGQKVVSEEVAFYNQMREHSETGEIPLKRWERSIGEGKSCLRPLQEGHDLQVIFSLHLERTVRKDGTISFMGRGWKVGKYPGEKVTVALVPDTKFMILKNDEKLWEYYL